MQSLETLIECYETDRATLERALPSALSPERYARLRRFLEEFQAALEEQDFEALDFEGRIDCLLFQNHLEYECRRLDLQLKKLREMDAFLPFAPIILNLEAQRRLMEPVEGAHAAASISEMNAEIAQVRRTLESPMETAGAAVSKVAAGRAVEAADALLKTFENWFQFYDGYDPLFTWWTREPFQSARQALQDYVTFLREKIVGVAAEEDAVIGDPIGREALLNELAHEMIPYTPEELIAIGDREFAWCEAQMRKAAQELGFGDDWLQALEHVKTRHVAPGEQPALVRDLALEAIAFVEDRALVTIPPLARECWRMEMMSPEKQKVNPFFLGGEVICVSFPTDGMSHERKRMSLRGNNRHFARATVFHELIPGHHLQLFMAERYRTYRRVFHTPFYVEGWALHWEMLLWDLDFARSPEDRIGMLFWRMHRCARIGFSLRFHLEQMTPQECIDLLVERVGHERDNAIAEVRRSVGPDYPPLYQCAYMLGGLQMRALYQEFVEHNQGTPREFHDAVLKQNAIPLEMLRAGLLVQSLPRDFRSVWRFTDPSPATS